MTITKIIETWSTRGLRYQVQLVQQLADNNQEWYEVQEYTRGRLSGCAVLNTQDSARNRLHLAIELGKLDGINYARV